MAVAHLDHAVEELQHGLTGHIILPTDTNYDEMRHGFNLGIDQHPALIVVVENSGMSLVLSVLRVTTI